MFVGKTGKSEGRSICTANTLGRTESTLRQRDFCFENGVFGAQKLDLHHWKLELILQRQIFAKTFLCDLFEK